mmetsp:Transcript_7488/g.7679  ORF Transcript_7488/g.7679 Transcript_7488/m.7679 type:complete len:128 (-) Transcript_7488:367-750(-)
MEVIRGEELRELGYGGLYNVGKAATKDPPALVVLTKRFSEHDNDKGEAVTLVGKGIVYDTGGLYLKISGGMVGMKTDCGGVRGGGALRDLNGIHADLHTLPRRKCHLQRFFPERRQSHVFFGADVRD